MTVTVLNKKFGYDYSSIMRGTEKTSTKNASNFEKRVSKILDCLDIKYTREPVIFSYEGKNRTLTFKPDFLLENLILNNKKIVIEPHGKRFFDEKFVIKLNKFMNSEEHDKYYLVLVTDGKTDNIEKRIKKRNKKLGIADICDEFIVSSKGSKIEKQQKIYLPLIRKSRNELSAIYKQIGKNIYNENVFISFLLSIVNKNNEYQLIRHE